MGDGPRINRPFDDATRDVEPVAGIVELEGGPPGGIREQLDWNFVLTLIFGFALVVVGVFAPADIRELVIGVGAGTMGGTVARRR